MARKQIKRGDILRHRVGVVGEAIADEADGKVLVEVRGIIQTWGIYELVDPAPPVDDYSDTTLDG
jgi:hypothetical protein